MSEPYARKVAGTDPFLPPEVEAHLRRCGWVKTPTGAWDHPRNARAVALPNYPALGLAGRDEAESRN